MNPQELQFELMKLASFNEFDGEQVVKDLQANPVLWKGALMDRAGFKRTDDRYESVISLIKLRDLPDYWNVDTLFIIPSPGHEDELEVLAKTWRADEVGWIGGEEACSKLGSYSPQKRAQEKSILKIWWD